jgi:hypothetical protein
MSVHFPTKDLTLSTPSSWAERLEAYKGTPYERQALLTISEEAAADGLNHDRELSLVALDAATLADEEQRALMVADVERILAEYAEVEAEDNRLARREYSGRAPMRRNWMEV